MIASARISQEMSGLERACLGMCCLFFGRSSPPAYLLVTVLFLAVPLLAAVHMVGDVPALFFLDTLFFSCLLASGLLLFGPTPLVHNPQEPVLCFFGGRDASGILSPYQWSWDLINGASFIMGGSDAA